ncbi:hypothetical protein lerEdw1_007391 [Lerista edwardsae]|nr:hypothetical protein lerEdw1_007391 [Lerista edwardsae]
MVLQQDPVEVPFGPPSGPQLFTWEDIWLRTKTEAPRRELWLVIDRKVYDVRGFLKRHPGGSRILNSHVGENVTEAFTAFHADKSVVKKFLNPLLVGELAPDQPSFEPGKNASLIEDFCELQTTVEKMGLLKPNTSFFMLQLLQVLLLDAASWLIFLYFGTSVLTFIVSLVLLTISQVQAKWLQHDLGHLSVFQSTKWNHLLHKYVMGNLLGASARWWTMMHSQHHAKPNCYTKDPDIDIHPYLFALGKSLAVELGKKKTKYLPYNHQHKYFSFSEYPQLLEGDFIVRPLRMAESSWFVWVSQMNHIPMTVDYDKQLDWVSTQGQLGQLCFPFASLFPRMPRHNYWKVAPLVKSLCAKHCIEYKSKPMLTAFADILQYVSVTREIWHNDKGPKVQ